MNRVHLLLLLAAASAIAQNAGLREERGIEYQPLPIRQYLDLTFPEGTGPFPAVVILHGGGFRNGGRADVSDLRNHLARAGFLTISADYRKPPQQLFPAPLNDVKSAIRWVHANAARLSIDADRIGVLGVGSGGYLAVLAALTGGVTEFEGIGPHREHSSRIRCAVAVDPLLNLQALDDELRASFLGGDPANAASNERRSDPLNWITPDAAPVLLLGRETPSSGEFVKRMSRAGVESAATRAGGPTETEASAISFLRSHLAPQPQTRIVISDHGPGAEVILMEWPSGRELWRAPNRRGHDAQALRNGNVLATLDEDGAVVEYDPRQPADGNIVWTYGAAEGLKLTISAERLANGNTVIADTGIGKLIEVTPQGHALWEYSNSDLAGNRMRHCRRTPSGSTLISVEAASKIIEVDRTGKIVWSWTAPGGAPRRPYQALRLPNGNTMISLMGPGELIEVEPNGKIVRSIGGGNGMLRIGWASGFDVLPNGNILIGDYTGQRLIEVDGSGRAVHELRMPHRPATVGVAP